MSAWAVYVYGINFRLVNEACPNCDTLVLPPKVTCGNSQFCTMVSSSLGSPSAEGQVPWENGVWKLSFRSYPRLTLMIVVGLGVYIKFEAMLVLIVPLGPEPIAV